MARVRSIRETVAVRLGIGRWKDLLRDSRRPQRTAVGAGLGALIGAMPILGLHTWIAMGAGATMPVPPLAVLAGSNLSNPLTFVPLTVLEIRLGQALLGRDIGFGREGFTLHSLGQYWMEAWTGFALVAPALGLLTGISVWALLLIRKRNRSQ